MEKHMKRFLYGLAALPFLAGVSLAADPVPLTDKQMDVVTAGFDFAETSIQNGGSFFVGINVPQTVPTCAAGTFLCIQGTEYPSGVHSFQLQAVFGP
jgi:hypothetical protein